MYLRNVQKLFQQRKNRDSLYSQAEYWNSKAEEYSGDATSMWANNHLNALYHDEQIGIIGRILPDLVGKKVLDLGCGTGRLTRWFAAQGAKVLGLDFSSRALEIAAQKSKGTSAEFRCQSMFDLQDKGAFDVVFCWAALVVALKNKSELEAVLRKVHQALKDGGELLLLEPIHKGFLHRVLNMNISEFIEVLRQSGFEVKSVKPFHFWPARLMLAYFTIPKPLTVFAYNAGETLMKLPGLKRLGDYHAIHAVRV